MHVHVLGKQIDTNRDRQRERGEGRKGETLRGWEGRGRDGRERTDRLCISVWLVAHSPAFVCLVLRFYLSASTLGLRNEKFFF